MGFKKWLESSGGGDYTGVVQPEEIPLAKPSSGAFPTYGDDEKPPTQNNNRGHVSGDSSLNCPDCEIKIDGKWRTGICDECKGRGEDRHGNGCSNCDATGHPVCCRCEGTGIDKNPD